MALSHMSLPLIPDFPPGFPPAETGIYDFSKYEPSELDAVIENALRHFGSLPRAAFENLVFGVPLFDGGARELIVPDELNAHNDWWSNGRPCCSYCDVCGFPVDPNLKRHYYEVEDRRVDSQGRSIIRRKNITHWYCYCTWILDDKNEINPSGLKKFVDKSRVDAVLKFSTFNT